MYGEAFKCDECGRVVFVPERHGPPTPPAGWFSMSQIPDVAEVDMVRWPAWQFDSIQCVRDFIEARMDMQIQALDAEDAPDEPDEPDLMVLSEWSAEDDDETVA